MNTKEQIQENQYHFPYHHLAHEENGNFYIFRHLFWGIVHYTYISYVIDRICMVTFDELADVGCGEGRIISELEKRNIGGNFLGIDISSKAIKFAEAFSNRSTFDVHDITSAPLEKEVDLLVSCEVIEHIEPDLVKDYIQNIHTSLKSGGKILITTPTTNVPVNSKHYQHFTSEIFDNLLKKKFTNIEYTYLNRVNFFSKLLERVISNRVYISNSIILNNLVLKLYKKHLLVSTKDKGSRIIVTAKKA